MIAREVETELLGYCSNHGIGVVAYSPMGVGLLTGKMTRERIAAFAEDDWRRQAKSFQEPKLSANLRLAERLRTVTERFDRPLSQLAIAWVLRRPEVTSAIVGARSSRQIEETAAAADWQLPEETIQEIEGLLREYEQSASS
jgi:aryl-alcohol dehydrogenase-like predicted oxidoreductase